MQQMRHVGEWGGKFVVPIPDGRGHRLATEFADMKVVLFCGGLGTRIREYSENIPKPMIPVGNQPIMWHVMQYYAHYGHRDFVLCLGYKANVIKDYFLNYRPKTYRDFVLSDCGSKVEVLGEEQPDWRIALVDTGVWRNIGQRLRAVRDHVTRTRRCSSPTTATASATSPRRHGGSLQAQRQDRLLPRRAAHLSAITSSTCGEGGRVREFRTCDQSRDLDQRRLFHPAP